MSFAGHVYDMIRRNKENREMLELRRDRHKERLKKMTADTSSADLPDLTPAEWERIHRGWKKRREQEQTYALGMKILYLGIGILAILLVWLGIRFLKA